MHGRPLASRSENWPVVPERLPGRPSWLYETGER